MASLDEFIGKGEEFVGNWVVQEGLENPGHLSFS